MQPWEMVYTIGQEPLLCAAALLIAGVVFVNGWTDAPNAIAACVTTRALSWRAAVGMAAVMNLLGAVCMSLLAPQVAVTVFRCVQLPGEAPVVLCAAMTAVVVWALAAWRCGIPTSESHGLLAGLSGAALAVGGVPRAAAWARVVCGLLLSTPLAFALALGVTRGVFRLCRHAARGAAHRRFRLAGCGAAATTACMHGAQDGQKFQGVLLLALLGGQENGSSVYSASLWLTLCIAAVMAVGTAVGGERIVRTVGRDMARITPPQGVAADLATTLCLLLCSLGGMPVSTTNVKTAAVMGAGAARRVSAVDWRVVRQLLLAWGLTFPACGVLGFLAAFGWRLLF